MTSELEKLLAVDPTLREEQWEKDFFHQLAHSQLQVMAEEPQKGPDGWPYLFVATDVEGSEPAGRVFDWLHDKGIGLVVNPQHDSPDFVFTYGMLWNYKERGEFLSTYTGQRAGQIKLEEGEKIHAGAPTKEFIPEYARRILRAFFEQQKAEARVLVMGRLPKAGAKTEADHYDLCFSLEAMGNPPASEHRGILEAISWFLPAHYSLMLVSEKGLPEFHPL